MSFQVTDSFSVTYLRATLLAQLERPCWAPNLFMCKLWDLRCRCRILWGFQICLPGEALYSWIERTSYCFWDLELIALVRAVIFWWDYRAWSAKQASRSATDSREDLLAGADRRLLPLRLYWRKMLVATACVLVVIILETNRTGLNLPGHLICDDLVC